MFKAKKGGGKMNNDYIEFNEHELSVINALCLYKNSADMNISNSDLLYFEQTQDYNSSELLFTIAIAINHALENYETDEFKILNIDKNTLLEIQDKIRVLLSSYDHVF